MNPSHEGEFQEHAKNLQKAIESYGLVFSLDHHEVLKKASKKLYSKQPICFISSSEPLLATHYKKLIGDFLLATSDREVIFYSGGSAERLISIVNDSAEDLSVETVINPQNAIVAKEKAIIIVEREEALMPDEWAILESMASELRYGTLGLILNLQNAHGNIVRESINKDLVFDFRELTQTEWDTLEHVKVTPDLSKGYEYLASVLEHREKVQKADVKDSEVDKSPGQADAGDLPASPRINPSPIFFNDIDRGNLSFIVFLTLLFFEFFYFAGKFDWFG